MTSLHLWLRAETHPSERRTPLTPTGAAALIEQGATVTVEDSPARCHPTEDYLRVGARAAAAGSWPEAPADAFVLGLKALPEGDGPITGRHLYFAHAYKGQEGADALLARFAAGRGEILDLEYLADGQGRRLAAFGHWAGYVGAALAIRQWNGDFDGPLAPASKTEFDAALRPPVRRPRVLVVGALGRCGRGARRALERVGITPVRWDLAETARLDREAILAHDILINAVGVTEPAEILLGPEHLRTGRRLSLIVDVTCDVGSPYHLLPVYDRLTTWDVPVRASVDGLAVIAIDNLPSLLPREASDDFSAQLVPHLSLLPDGDAWKRSRRAFRTALRDEELDHV